MPNYLNFFTFSKDLLAAFMVWFYSAFCSLHINIYLVFSALTSQPTLLLYSVFFFTACVVKDSELLGCEATPLLHPAVRCHIPGDWNPRLHQSGNLKAHKSVFVQEINKISIDHRQVCPISVPPALCGPF